MTPEDEEPRCVCGHRVSCHNPNGTFCYHCGDCNRFRTKVEEIDVSKIDRVDQDLLKEEL